MKKNLCLFVLIAMALGATACGFEHSRSITAPSADSGGGSDSPVGEGPLTGVWTSLSSGSIPSGASCTSFQWRITGQTSSSLVGEFYANCAGGLVVSGVASGELRGNDVDIRANGTATLPSVLSCGFTLASTGHIDGDAMRIPYTGDTCFGPVRGEETLRRPSPAAPPPPPPDAPAPPPPPASNPHHVGDGPLTTARAEQVVRATGDEFAHLRAPRGSESEAIGAGEELLLRMIWHLQLAGYQAGRQRNPSGAISNDKLTIHINGGWHSYDVFLDNGRPGVETKVIFYEVFPPGYTPNSGIPD